MKLKFYLIIISILNISNLFSQWNLPLFKNDLKLRNNVFYSKSIEGALALNYCLNDEATYSIQLCIDELNVNFDEEGRPVIIDSSKFNYDQIAEYKIQIFDLNNNLQTYTYNPLKDTILKTNDQNYFGGGWDGSFYSGPLYAFNLNENDYISISNIGIKLCECPFFFEYDLDKTFLKSDFFKKMLKSKNINFQFIDNTGKIKSLNISMKNHKELLSILNHTSYFDNDYWFWDEDNCLTKWKSTIHNKSGNIILKNQTLTFELLQYNSTIFKKIFPVSQNIGVGEVVPIDLLFETPLCIDNIEELDENYTWKINLN